MGAALPFGQTPAQTGLASILAALGQAAPANGGAETGGFEQLFANLPTAPEAPVAVAVAGAGAGAGVMAISPGAAVPTMEPTATTPLPPPAAALFGMPQPAPEAGTIPLPTEAAPGEVAIPADTAVKTPIAPIAPITSATSAAAADTPLASDPAAVASLLIAAIAPAPTPTPNNISGADRGAEDAPAPDDVKADADAAPTPAPAFMTPDALPVAEITAALPAVAAAIPVIAQPVAARPGADQAGMETLITGKPVKTDSPVVTPRATVEAAAKAVVEAAETSPATHMARTVREQSPAVRSPAAADAVMADAKPADTARPSPEMATPAEPTTAPRTAKPLIDAGASMTVLFQQSAATGPAALAQAAAPASVAERVLDVDSDDQWIAQLAADIAATRSDKGDISFRLMPRHLGRLDVSMLGSDEGVTVRLDTQHEATAAIVSAAQPRLVEDLRQQGVRVADAQVTHTPTEAGRQQQQNQGQGRGTAPDASHLIETAAERHDSETDKRAADRRGRFA